MTLPDKLAFVDQLGAALAAPRPAVAIRKLLRRILTEGVPSWDKGEQQFVRGLSERLDTVNSDEDRFVALARDIYRLLSKASSNEIVIFLLEVVAERRRALSVIRKFAHGYVSRTSFLSFVSEQKWPDFVRRRIVSLSPADLQSLAVALDTIDVPELENMLIT